MRRIVSINQINYPNGDAHVLMVIEQDGEQTVLDEFMSKDESPITRQGFLGDELHQWLRNYGKYNKEDPAYDEHAWMNILLSR